MSTTRKKKEKLLDIRQEGVYNVSMKRTNFHLTLEQIKRLKKISKETGLSVAELIRRAVDAFLSRKKN